jgi:hypothetical protein
MNQRIRHLAEQTHVTVLTTKGMENISDGCYVVSPDKLQEFAELLIKEMLDVQRQLKIAGVEHGSDMDQTLLVYFGV